jgi:hypothetical protein
MDWSTVRKRALLIRCNQFDQVADWPHLAPIDRNAVRNS